MIQYERQRKILDILKEKNPMTIEEISEKVFFSQSTVRRDIKALEQQGYVHCLYGSVMLSEYRNSVVPVNMRNSSFSAVKENLAKQAAEMIFDDAVVIMDSASTVRRICKYIKPNIKVKIITNNLSLFDEPHGDNIKMYCTGGLYNPLNRNFVGAGAEKYIKAINADIVFFSSQGISEEGDISDVSEEETALRQAMLEHAKQKVFLCDSSKIGEKKTFTLCSKDDIDKIICDIKLPWE